MSFSKQEPLSFVSSIAVTPTRTSTRTRTPSCPSSNPYALPSPHTPSTGKPTYAALPDQPTIGDTDRDHHTRSMLPSRAASTTRAHAALLLSRTGATRMLSLTGPQLLVPGTSRNETRRLFQQAARALGMSTSSRLPQQHQQQHPPPPKSSTSSYGVAAAAAAAAATTFALQPDSSSSSSSRRLAACQASSPQEASTKQQQPPRQAGLPHEFLAGLQEIVGQENVTDDVDECAQHGKPWSSYHKIPSVPDVVVQPGSTEEVSRVLRLCWYVLSSEGGG